MHFLNRFTRLTGLLFLFAFILFSCKKEQNPTPSAGENGNPGSPIPSCGPNSGSFSIKLNDTEYQLVIDSETQYTNLYNWFGYEESDFIIDGKDQNSNHMHLELGLPGKFLLGTKTYSSDSLDFDFFDFQIDTFNLYVSKITFTVLTSNLDEAEGIYRPLKASFTGLAHSYPWFNGQAPADTVVISGTICLNGVIMP